MDNLTPVAQAVYDALADGPGDLHEIRERTGKSESAITKAFRLLFAQGLIANANPDAADGMPARWIRSSEPVEAAATHAAPDTSADGTEPGDTPPVGSDDTTSPSDARPVGDTTTADSDAVSITPPEPEPDRDATPDRHRPAPELAEPDLPGTDASNATVQAETNAAAAAVGAGNGDGDSTTDADNREAPEGEPKAEPPAPRPVDRSVFIVAGVLGDYPDGATIDVIAAACGLGWAKVMKLLVAMETANAARRRPADETTGTPERWAPGDGKASDVDTSPAAPPRCPSCGQIIRNRPGQPPAGQPPTGTGTVNTDGNTQLARNELRGLVLAFINEHPGHVLTPQAIAAALGERLGRQISGGAVRNNCTTLAAAGQIQLATETPLQFTTNPADTDTTTS